MNSSEIIRAIMAGDADDGLNDIIDAAITRRRQAARVAAAKMDVGTRVRLVNVKPKYLGGIEGEITRPMNSEGQVMVRLDHAPVSPRSSRRFKQEMWVSPQIIEVV